MPRGRARAATAAPAQHRTMRCRRRRGWPARRAARRRSQQRTPAAHSAQSAPREGPAGRVSSPRRRRAGDCERDGDAPRAAGDVHLQRDRGAKRAAGRRVRRLDAEPKRADRALRDRKRLRERGAGGGHAAEAEAPHVAALRREPKHLNRTARGPHADLEHVELARAHRVVQLSDGPGGGPRRRQRVVHSDRPRPPLGEEEVRRRRRRRRGRAGLSARRGDLHRGEGVPRGARREPRHVDARQARGGRGAAAAVEAVCAPPSGGAARLRDGPARAELDLADVRRFVQ
eukprot:gene106-biopygen8132